MLRQLYRDPALSLISQNIAESSQNLCACIDRQVPGSDQGSASASGDNVRSPFVAEATVPDESYATPQERLAIQATLQSQRADYASLEQQYQGALRRIAELDGQIAELSVAGTEKYGRFASLT